jgi:uncharacterized protein
MAWYGRAAQPGNQVVQSVLDQMRAEERGAPRDGSPEAPQYRGPAERSATAQSALGLRYAMGQGLPQDYAEAVKWYKRAAEQGVAFAQFTLGVRYAHGQGVLSHGWPRRGGRF